MKNLDQGNLLNSVLLHLEVMLVPCRVTTSIKFAAAPLYTWVDRTVSCPCAQHKVTYKASPQTAQSGDEHTSNEA